MNSKYLWNEEIILQVAVNEVEFSVFNKRLQELGLIVLDVRPVKTDVEDGHEVEFWMTFRFVNGSDFFGVSSALMSVGSLRRIVYRYRE